jgi:hypothetical protein
VSDIDLLTEVLNWSHLKVFCPWSVLSTILLKVHFSALIRIVLIDKCRSRFTFLVLNSKRKETIQRLAHKICLKVRRLASFHKVCIVPPLRTHPTENIKIHFRLQLIYSVTKIYRQFMPICLFLAINPVNYKLHWYRTRLKAYVQTNDLDRPFVKESRL